MDEAKDATGIRSSHNQGDGRDLLFFPEDVASSTGQGRKVTITTKNNKTISFITMTM